MEKKIIYYISQGGWATPVWSTTTAEEDDEG